MKLLDLPIEQDENYHPNRMSFLTEMRRYEPSLTTKTQILYTGTTTPCVIAKRTVVL